MLMIKGKKIYINDAIILLTVIMVIVLSLGSWFVYHSIIDKLIHYYSGQENNFQIVSTQMSGQLKLHLWFMVSIGVLPIIACLVTLGLNKFKRRLINVIAYLKYFVWILLGYSIGAIARIALLGVLVRSWVLPNMPNIMSFRSIQFYNWGIIGALSAGILLFLLTKKQIIRRK